MKKLTRLLWVMHRCGSSNNENKAASKAVGDSSSIIMIMIMLGLAAAMTYAGRYFALHENIFGGGDDIFGTIMLIGGLGALVLSIPRMINQLYMSGDLDVLVTMPFTPMEIVAAKLVNAAAMPLGICCGVIIPTGIGYGFTLGITSVLYWIGVLISGVLLSFTASSLAGILVIVVMRVFRRIRSRNMIAVITALFSFGATAAYLLMSGSDSEVGEEAISGLFKTVQDSLSGVAKVIPMTGLTADAMFNSAEWYKLLLSVAATAVAVALILIAAKYLYFAAALGMTDANSVKGAMSDGKLAKATRGHSVRHSLIKRELMTLLRIPAMISNGYLQSYIVPLIVFVPIVLKLIDVEDFDKLAPEVGSMLPAGLMMLIFEALTAIIISLSVGLSSVSSSIISREGKDYQTLKAMPIPMRSVVEAKYRVATLVNFLPAVGYSVALAVWAVVIGFAPAWSIAVVIGFGIPFYSFMISFCALHDVEKPNLNWENEADVCKSNMRGIILFGVVFAAVIGIGYVFAKLDASDTAVLVAAIGVIAAGVVGAVISFMALMKAADNLPKRY